jgi:hypothetical protein
MVELSRNDWMVAMNMYIKLLQLVYRKCMYLSPWPASAACKANKDWRWFKDSSPWPMRY